MSAPTRPWRRALGALVLPLLLAGLVTAGTPGWTSVVVHRGDTLSEIAKRYHTSVARLVRANDLPGKGHLIYAGQALRVPTAAAQARIAQARRATVRRTPARSARSSRSAYRTVYRSYTVKSGDSLIRIARHFGTRSSAVRLANRIPVSGVVRIGQTLRIPVARRVPTRARTTRPRTTTPRTTTPRTTTARTTTPRATTPRTRTTTFAGRTYPDATVNRAAINRRKLASRSLPSRARMRAIISATARANGVSPSLALAVAYQESGFNPGAVSVANAIGAMQVVPSTGAWASSVIGRPLNLLDPRDNATAGVVLLRVLTRSARTTEEAVAGYYQGLASVRRNGMYADTRHYVANVLRLRAGFQ